MVYFGAEGLRLVEKILTLIERAGPGGLGLPGVGGTSGGGTTIRAVDTDQHRDLLSGEMNQVHNVGGGQGPYSSKFADNPVEGGIREKKQQLAIVKDLVEEAVNGLGHHERINQLQDELIRQKTEAQDKFSELLDKFTQFKYSQPAPKNAIDLLNDLTEDKQAAAAAAAAQQLGGTGGASPGGTGSAPDTLAVARTLVERKHFLKLQEEVAAIRGFVMSSNQELHHQKENLRSAIEQTMANEKKKSQKELAQLWEEKNALAVG